MTARHRYPWAPLAAAMGLSEHQAAARLGVSGTTQQTYRRIGVLEETAERLADKAGLHPFEVWPELLEHRLADAEARRRALDAARQRRYRDRHPEARARAREYRRRYYAEHGEYERAQERRRYYARKAEREQGAAR